MIEMFGEGPIELDPRYYTTSTSIIDDEMIKNEVVPSEIRTQNITEDKIPLNISRDSLRVLACNFEGQSIH